MHTRGRHLIVEYLNCDVEILNNCEVIKQLLIAAAEAANTRVVSAFIKPFVPQGVSGVVVIEESHISIHTWPEHKYAAVDFFTCGDGDPEIAHKVLLKGLKAQKTETMLLSRGNIGDDSVIQYRYHNYD